MIIFPVPKLFPPLNCCILASFDGLSVCWYEQHNFCRYGEQKAWETWQMGFDKKNIDLEQMKHYNWRKPLFHNYRLYGTFFSKILCHQICSFKTAEKHFRIEVWLHREEMKKKIWTSWSNQFQHLPYEELPLWVLNSQTG